ncbi:MAG TPA: hypothetical protein VGK16_11670 [Candidatus Limnocylindrales bacterium]
MHDSTRARLLGGVATLSVVAAVVGQLLFPPSAFDPTAAAVFIPAVASFGGVGALLAFRVPANRIGWMLLASGVMIATLSLSSGYVSASAAAGLTWPLTTYVAWLSDLMFAPPIVIVAAAVPMVYPDGHLPSPGLRWLAWLLVAGTVGASVQPAFSAEIMVSATTAIANPFAMPGLTFMLDLANTLASLSAPVAFIGAFAAVATRYRRGSAVERQQIKWLLATALVGAIAFPAAFVSTIVGFPQTVGDIAIIVGFLGLVALPVAIGFAILRYRLYEIDRIISRTIGWAVVTGVLVTVFAAGVVLLQATLAPFTRENTLAVAASTLVAFALFQPVRRRVQRAVDRRFDRARYDGERTVEAFADRLRGHVDLPSLRASLLATTDAAVRPREAGLWLRTRREA